MRARPKRPVTKIKTSLAFSKKVLAMLKAEAIRQDRSVSYIVERILEREVGKMKEPDENKTES